MVKVTLKGGAVKEYDDNVTVAEIAKSLGGGLYKAACAGKLNGRVVDLRTPVTEDSEVELLTFDSQEGKRAYWHTTSHIMAQAVGRLRCSLSARLLIKAFITILTCPGT